MRSGRRAFRSLATLALALGLAMPAMPVSAEADAVVRPAYTRIAFLGRVTDAALVLGAEQRGALAGDLAAIEARTSHQIVIATVPTLAGEDIAAYARQLGNSWGVGGARRNNGVVILLAPREQKVRIAVGTGLDTVLTDAVCQQIIDQVMLPELREGRLYEGLARSVAALNAVL